MQPQGYAMQVAGSFQGRTVASTVGAGAPPGANLSPRDFPDQPRPQRYDRPQAAGRQHAGLRRRCRRAAKRIRRSTGIAQGKTGNEAAVVDRPWPRLLLWLFACAALVVSHIIRAEGLDGRDPGSAVRATAVEGVAGPGLPLLSSILQRGDAGVQSVRNGRRG